jgi:hypothetical protein
VCGFVTCEDGEHVCEQRICSGGACPSADPRRRVALHRRREVEQDSVAAPARNCLTRFWCGAADTGGQYKWNLNLGRDPSGPTMCGPGRASRLLGLAHDHGPYYSFFSDQAQIVLSHFFFLFLWQGHQIVFFWILCHQIVWLGPAKVERSPNFDTGQHT